MRIECKYDEMMPLLDVLERFHPDNENEHSENQIRSLSKVIAKIGIRHAIHISKLSGKIAGGHGRAMAFKKLGYDEVPIVWENFNDELEEINYRASDNIGQYAEFDYKQYTEHLEDLDLDLEDLDLEEFGLIGFNGDIDGIEEVEDFNEGENLTIACESLIEFADLQMKLSTTKKKITYKDFITAYEEYSNT